jgi:hypothetical protein
MTEVDGVRKNVRSVFRRCASPGAIVAAMALSFTLSPAAHAAQAAWLPSETNEFGDLIDSGAPPDGRTTWGSSLKFSGPGKLTVSAYDLGVEGTLMPPVTGLSFSVTNSTSLLGSHDGAGQMAFQIGGAGEYFVNFSALAAGPFSMPLVSWAISFQPNASAVPLPAGVWLMLAGLAWAIGLQRKRAKLAGRDGGDVLSWISAGALAH